MPAPPCQVQKLVRKQTARYTKRLKNNFAALPSVAVYFCLLVYWE